MKRFSEMNLPLIGAIGLVWALVAMYGALNLGPLIEQLRGGGYSAIFSEAGGLHSGDEVRVSGVTVGRVKSVELDGNQVRVSFTANGADLGSETEAAVKTLSGLGTKFLALTPAGSGKLQEGAQIPQDRTTSAYDLTEALADVTVTTGRIDTAKLAEALDTVSSTFATSAPQVRATLDGVRRLSRAVAARDDALAGVLQGADGVSGVLAARNADIVSVLTNGNALLSELEIRRQTLSQLFAGVTTLTRQLTAVVEENDGILKPALAELRRSLKVINAHADELGTSIEQLSGFGRSLMEAVGGGPFFYGYVVNLAPTSLAPMLPELFGAQARGVR